MIKLMSLLCFTFLLNQSLTAEIERITIRWTAQLCQASCFKLLEREFGKIQGVQEISINQGAGEAIIRWKKRVPFQFTSINTAMHMVGLSIRDIRIRVIGSIRHIGETIYIISEEDQTRFDLLNPLIPHPTGQAAEFNAAVRKLNPGLRQKLLEGEALQLIATIEGPIFMPERMTIPTQLVVDHLSFADPAEADSNSPQ